MHQRFWLPQTRVAAPSAAPPHPLDLGDLDLRHISVLAPAPSATAMSSKSRPTGGYSVALAMVRSGIALPTVDALLAGVDDLTAQASLRHLETSGSYARSVALTNCGELGWSTEAATNATATSIPCPGSPGRQCRKPSGNGRRTPRGRPAFRTPRRMRAWSTAANPARVCRCTRTATNAILTPPSYPCRWACRRCLCSGETRWRCAASSPDDHAFYRPNLIHPPHFKIS